MQRSPHRHTNRGAYDTARPVDAGILAAMGDLAIDPDVALVWLTTAAQMQSFADLTLRATEAIIADPEQACDDFSWWRADWHAIQRNKDGITLDPAGLPDLTRALGKILPANRSPPTTRRGWTACGAGRWALRRRSACS